MKRKYISLRTQALVFTCLLSWAGIASATNITISIDGVNPDVNADLDLSTLMPIAENNTWSYDLLKGSSATPKSVVAEVGSVEKIGGGCLKLHPIVFGDELILYLGNYGDQLSLHGIYINRWKGLDDLQMKFETRHRAEWLDFRDFYISDAETPIDANSCQNTGRGRVERTGLVLLEDLTEHLGEAGKKRGEISCKAKNSDLRDARIATSPLSPAQHGSGVATVRGQAQTLYWSLDGLTLTPDYLQAGDLRVEFVFNPDIHSSGTDYSMYIDMTLRAGQGITALQINDDASYVMDEIHDLSYTFVDASLASGVNELTPKGNCPDDSGRFSLFILLMLMGFVPFRTRKVSKG